MDEKQCDPAMGDDGFQAFADASGISGNFRMNTRSLTQLCVVYDAWRSLAPATEWEAGYAVQWRRILDIVEMTMSGGNVVRVRLRRPGRD
jgi:hypothetical protein